jgi:hypothetical protein
MLKGPVRGEMVPAVVLQFPAVISKSAHLGAGEGLGVQVVTQRLSCTVVSVWSSHWR